MKKIVVVLTAVLTLTGCSLFAPATAGPIELTDDFDRTIALEQPAMRIISLAPSTTELLFALGVGDRIVGATEYCNYPEAALKIERMGAFDNPNLELIVALEPDLVLAASLHKEPVEAMEGMGIPVLALDPKDFAGIYSNIRVLAAAVGREQAGEELIAQMQDKLESVTAALADVVDEERPWVYYEVWYPDPMTVGGGTFIDQIINLAGGRNIAHDLSGYPVISEEALIERNPQVILHGHFDADAEMFAQREGWDIIAAVAAGEIYYVDQDIINRTGPRMVDAVEILARLFHPDIFD